MPVLCCPTYLLDVFRISSDDRTPTSIVFYTANGYFRLCPERPVQGKNIKRQYWKLEIGIHVAPKGCGNPILLLQKCLKLRSECLRSTSQNNTGVGTQTYNQMISGGRTDELLVYISKTVKRCQ